MQLGGDHARVGDQMAQRIVDRSVCGEAADQVEAQQEPPECGVALRRAGIDLDDPHLSAGVWPVAP